MDGLLLLDSRCSLSIVISLLLIPSPQLLWVSEMKN